MLARQSFVLLLGCLLAAIRPGLTAHAATSVYEAEGLGHTGYEAGFTAADCPNEDTCIHSLGTVPTGKRLILTHISCQLQLGIVDGTQGIFKSYLRSAQHPSFVEWLIPVKQPAVPNLYIINTMTNLIFDAGDQPQFVFQAYNSTSQKPDLGFACMVVGYRTSA
jgi:hypothetical protein